MNKNDRFLPNIVLEQLITFFQNDVSIYTQDKPFMQAVCNEYDDKYHTYNEMWSAFVAF